MVVFQRVCPDPVLCQGLIPGRDGLTDTAPPEDESLWTVPIFRQWPLSFRAFIRSADKSLRNFLKGRHGVFLRGVYRVEAPEPR